MIVMFPLPAHRNTRFFVVGYCPKIAPVKMLKASAIDIMHWCPPMFYDIYRITFLLKIQHEDNSIDLASPDF